MSLKKKIDHWQKDEQGNMAIIFALLLVPLLAVITLSIDFSKASTDKIGLQNAAEMAVHKAATAFGKNFKQRQGIARQTYISFLSSRQKERAHIEVKEGKDVISQHHDFGQPQHDFGLSQKDGYYIFTVDKIQRRTVSQLMGLGDIKLHVTAKAKIPVSAENPDLLKGLVEIDKEQQREALRRLRLLMERLRDQGYFR